MENFRTINDGLEIASLIQQADRQDMGQIWQTQGPIRHTYQILDLVVDIVNEAVVFETRLPFDLNRKYPVYVRITNRNLIFKITGAYIVKKNRLICPIPYEAKANEMRIVERHTIPEDRNIHLRLKPLETAAMEVKVKLLNFSQRGMGILVSDVNQEYFQRIENFSLQSIAGMNLGNQKLVQVKHVGARSKGSAKVGLFLKESFDQTTFNTLQTMLL